MMPVNMRNDFGHADVHKLPTPDELAKLQAGGRLQLFTYTYGQAFQSVQLQAVGPDEMLPLETVS